MGNFKKNISYQMLYRLLSIITPLITSPIISRALGPKQLGVFSATQAYVNYFVLFAMLGIEYYGQRSIASSSSKQEQQKVFWEIYFIQVISSVFSILLYFLSILFLDTSRISIIFIQSLWIISCLFDINWYFFGIEDFKSTVTRNFVVKIITVISIVLFIKTPNDIYLYTFIMAGSVLLSQIVLWLSVKRYISFTKVSFKNIKRHVWPIIRLFIPMIAISIYHIMDKTMLDIFSTDVEVGYYYAADKIIYIPLGLITAVGTVVLPRISNLESNGSFEKIKQYLYKSSELSVFLSCALGFGILSIADYFVPIFFGPGFEKCVVLLSLFVPVLFIKTFSNIVDQQFLIPLKMDNQYTICIISGALTNLLLNYILIPKFGSIGATLATFSAELIVLVISIIFTLNKINFIKIFFNNFEYFVMGLIMFLGIRFISNFIITYNPLLKLFILVLFGAIIYLSLCAVSWIFFKKNSIFNIKEAIRRE